MILLDIASLFKRLIRPNKHIVIELDDEVEDILDENAIENITKGLERVFLTRVIDRTPHLISVRRIIWALDAEGVIDYISNK